MDETSMLKEKLVQLRCPFISEVDNWSIREMLFKPGDSRLKLFQWLQNKIYPGLPITKFATSQTDYSAILEIVRDCGYRCADVAAVIKGTASIEEQAHFLNFLLNAIINIEYPFLHLFCAFESSNLSTVSQCDTMLRSDIRNTTDHLPREKIHKFINAIVDNVSSDFDLSACIRPNILIQTKNPGPQSSKLTRTTGPLSDLRDLQNCIKGLDAQIQEINAKLDALPSILINPNVTDQLQDVAKQLDTLSSHYEDVHTNEMQTFCRKPQKLNVSEMGPVCESVKEELKATMNISNNAAAFNDFRSTLKHHKEVLDQLSVDDKISDVNCQSLKFGENDSRQNYVLNLPRNTPAP